MKTQHPTMNKCLTLVLGALVLLTFSCKKSPNTIGNNLIDSNSYIGVFHTDTTLTVCHSFLDSIGTKKVTYATLGSMKDPVFGSTCAGFYTQFHLSSSGHSYGEDAVFDSLVLQLYVNNYYGDTTTLQTVHVYQMTDTLSTKDQYYSYSDMPIDNIDHANSYQYYPRPKTAGHILTNDTISRPVIRIPLSQELGTHIMTLGSQAYSEPDLFTLSFPGLYVMTESVNENGSVCYLNLTNNTYTQLQLYYHNEENPGKTMRYDFYVTANDVYFNRFIHDYTQGDAAFVDQVLNDNVELGQQNIYLQSMGGVKAFIQFPNLEHWADTLQDAYIIINEAKLTIPAAPMDGDSTLYEAPASLVLVGINEDGTTYLLPDYYEGSNYFGGTYSKATKSVTFRIAEYLEDMIRGIKPNKGLTLGINGAAFNASRWIIAGPEAEGENKLNLEVTYSIIAK